MRVRRELQQRLEDIEKELAGFEGLRKERDRIRRAVALLDDVASSEPAKRSGARNRAARRPAAPRGANRQRALAAIGEHPGITLGELATLTGIGRTTLAALARRLETDGSIVRFELPGGQRGLRLPNDGAEADQSPPGPPDADVPAADSPQPAQAKREEPPSTEPAEPGGSTDREPAKRSSGRRRAKAADAGKG